MTLGELKKKIKQLEIDHPELTDKSNVFFDVEEGTEGFCSIRNVRVDQDDDLILT